MVWGRKPRALGASPPGSAADAAVARGGLAGVTENGLDLGLGGFADRHREPAGRREAGVRIGYPLHRALLATAEVRQQKYLDHKAPPPGRPSCARPAP